MSLAGRFLSGVVNTFSGAARGYLRGAGVPKEALWQAKGVGHLTGAVGYGVGLGTRGVAYAAYLMGAGVVATGKHLPGLAGRLVNDAAALGNIGARGFTGLARRMVGIDDKGIRITPLGKAVITGGVLAAGAMETFNALEQRQLGYVNVNNVYTLPQLAYEGVKNDWDTGADGSLVFALHNLRHG